MNNLYLFSYPCKGAQSIEIKLINDVSLSFNIRMVLLIRKLRSFTRFLRLLQI